METMAAGQKLDALIAVEIMGLQPCGPPLGDWMYWDEQGRAIELPDYSTDITDAMEVLCKIRGPEEREFRIQGERNHLYRCIVFEDLTNIMADGSGDTISEAICRAALVVAEKEQ